MTTNEPAQNPLRDYFERNPGRLIDKWLHYFDIYHRHFQRFRGAPVTVLEIGIFQGGSLQMWRDYFGPQSRIIGVDINPRVMELAEPGVEIVVGDQADRAFLRQLREQVGTIDILIDDGGHTMVQQISTLEELYGSLSENGVYLAEDLHTSYWREYGGGFRHTMTFMELAKSLVDQLNGWHSRDGHSFHPTGFTAATQSMHFYDSVLVIERGAHPKPEKKVTGTPVFPMAY
jgi:23S rRNA U2552 (ribose-2'-O)-methylase RlmE/FtsJ